MYSRSPTSSLATTRCDGRLVYLANDGGVWISVDHGATWHDLNLGLITSEIATVGVSGTAALGDQMHGGLVGTTSFPSPTWSFYQGGSWELAEVHGDPVRPGRFFVQSAADARAAAELLAEVRRWLAEERITQTIVWIGEQPFAVSG
jgi:hypothetical protein